MISRNVYYEVRLRGKVRFQSLYCSLSSEHAQELNKQEGLAIGTSCEVWEMPHQPKDHPSAKKLRARPLD